MWTLEDIIKEISDVAELIGAKPSDPVFGQSLVKGICSKVMNLEQQLTAGDGLKILNKASLLSPGLKELLQQCVQKKLLSAPVQQSMLSLKPQTLLCPYNYFTKSEWELISNAETTLKNKMSTMCIRLRSLGFVSLSEQTVKAFLTLLISTLDGIPNRSIQLEYVLKLKQAFAETPCHVKQPYVRQFPDHPSGLPPDMLATAYPAEQPCAVQIELFATIFSQTWVRKDKASQSSTASSATQACVPTQQSQPNDVDRLINAFGAFGSMLGQMSQGWQSGNNGCNLVMNPTAMAGKQANVAQAAQPLQPTCKTQTPHVPPQLALPAPSQSEQEDAKPPADSAALPLTSDALRTGAATSNVAQDLPKGQPEGIPIGDYEDAAYQALQNRGTSGKGKSRGRGRGGKGEGKASKPPKPSKPVKKGPKTMKRPAASKQVSQSGGSFKYVVYPPTEAHLKSSKACYVDLHYHKAKNIALNMGMDYDIALGHGRVARATAVKLWDEA